MYTVHVLCTCCGGPWKDVGMIVVTGSSICAYTAVTAQLHMHVYYYETDGHVDRCMCILL